MTETFPQLTVRQRLSMMTNRFEIRQGGKEGRVLAIAQQKRLAMKEKVTFYADEERTQPLFGFQAQQVMDLGATYDIVDASDQQIGWFRKDFGKSLFNSTFHVGVPAQGLEGVGSERSAFVAFARRFLDIGWPVHFDYAAADGTPILAIERAWMLRDSYDVTLPAAPNGARIDWRVAAALTVGMDVLLAR